MAPTLALVHTTAVTVTTLRDLAAEQLPGVRVINLLDDSLLPDVIAAGGVTNAVEQRLRAYVAQAALAGADAVVCCCSSVGEAAERIATTAPVPVLRIDDAMAELAVAGGARVGVIATLDTTLGPTVGLIRRKARAAGRDDVQVEAVTVEGAYAALAAGRGEEHDGRAREALAALLARADVVVLAQASMARILASLPAPPRVPVLSSPVSGLRRAGEVLGVR